MKKDFSGIDAGWLTLIASGFAVHFGNLWGGFLGTFLEVIGWIYIGLFFVVLTIGVIVAIGFIIAGIVGMISAGVLWLLNKKDNNTKTPEQLIASVKKQNKKKGN